MKYCPLKPIGANRQCDELKCAWYYIDTCSIREIAFLLKSIDDELISPQDITKGIVDAKE